MIKVIYKKLFKLISKLFILIFIVFLLSSSFIIYQEFRYPLSIPPLTKHKFLYVLTGSMEPTIQTGDVIIIKKVNIDEIQVEDIITFNENNTLITHRVFKIINNNNSISFVTKGDANDTVDQDIVLSNQVLGKNILIIPKIGYVVRFLSSPFGFISLIILPIFYVTISEIKSIIKKDD